MRSAADGIAFPADIAVESRRQGFVSLSRSDPTASGSGVLRAYHSAAAELIDDTGYKRRLPELEAIRACLDGTIPEHLLAPDRDKHGQPLWHDLALSLF